MIRSIVLGFITCVSFAALSQSPAPDATFGMEGEKENIRAFQKLNNGYLMLTTKSDEVFAYKLSASFKKEWATSLDVAYYPGWAIDQMVADKTHLYAIQREGNQDGKMGLQVVDLATGKVKKQIVKLPFSEPVLSMSDGGEVMRLLASDGKGATYVEVKKADLSVQNKKSVVLPRLGGSDGKWTYGALANGWYYWGNSGYVLEYEEDADAITMDYFGWNPQTDGQEESSLDLNARKLRIDGHFVHGFRDETPVVGSTAYTNGPNAVPTYIPEQGKVFLAGYWDEQSWPKASGFWVVQAQMDAGKVSGMQKVLVDTFWSSKDPFRMDTYYAPVIESHPDLNMILIHHAEYIDRKFLKENLGHTNQGNYYTSVLVDGKELTRSVVDIGLLSGKSVLYSVDRFVNNGTDLTVTSYFKDLQYSPEMPPFFKFFKEVSNTLDNRDAYAFYYDPEVQVFIVSDQKDDLFRFYRYQDN